MGLLVFIVGKHASVQRDVVFVPIDFLGGANTNLEFKIS